MNAVKVNCFECGADNSINASFCINCGAQLKSIVEVKIIRTCDSCKSEIFIDSNYCPHCGTNLNDFKLDKHEISFDEYAPTYIDYAKDNILNEKMISVLEKLESDSKLNQSIDLWHSIAIGYSNYCSWYVRGDNRKKYLEKIVYYLDKILKTTPDEDSTKMELGRLLIEEKLIRDLAKGKEYLEELKSKDKLPIYLEPSLQKAKRQLGDISLRDVLDFREIDPSPAIFIEERKKYRNLVNRFTKENDIENAKKVLYEFYNFAFLATLCFPNYDFVLGITGNYYDEAKIIVKSFGSSLNYSFDKNGYLDNCRFLSDKDYKTFIKIYGDTKLHTDPLRIL